MRFYLSKLLLSIVVITSVVPAYGSVVNAWTGGNNSRHTTPLAACKSFSSVWGVVYLSATYADCGYPGSSGCVGGCAASYLISQNCPLGHTGLFCNLTQPTCQQGTFDPNANKCIVASEKGAPDQSLACYDEPSKAAGNPINFATGSKFHEEILFSSVGGIVFKQYYNSADGKWRYSYSERLVFLQNEILLNFSDGKTLRYTNSGAPKETAAVTYGELRPVGDGWQFSARNRVEYFFDAQGRLVSIKLPNGIFQRLTYVVDGPFTRITVKDDLGGKIDFKQNSVGWLAAFSATNMSINLTYGNHGLIIKSTKTHNGQQSIRQYHYEDPYNNLHLTGLTDERGIRYATWRYDTQGRAISSEHAGTQGKVKIDYHPDGSATITNPLGKRTTYRFQSIDGSKKITAVEGEASINCPNSNSTFTYNARALLKTKTDNKGNLTTYDYNERGLEASRTKASGTSQARIITTEWHPTFFLPIKITEPGKTTTYTYDEQGRLLNKSAPNWNYAYNSLGLIETADGPRTDVQDVTTYAYDAQGRVTTVTNALGHITQLSNFDNYGNPQNLIDANGVQTSLTYTPQGWLASASTAGSTTSFEHDAVGLITKVTRGDDSWLSYTWDGARRLTKITNNLGETIEYSLDAMGNRTAQRLKDASNSLTQQQTWVYDELGRLLRSVGAAGQTSGYQYDLNDNPTVSTNPKQHSNTQAYDALDRLVSSTDPLNGVTALAYDAQDNLTQVQDPRGVTTQYQYDGLGNLTKQISPDSGTTTFSHDAAGNVISKTDARGVVTTYTYDALNRLTGRQYPANPALNVQYHYDMTASGNKGIGRLTAVQDASGVLGYSYDERGNLIGQLRSVALSNGDHYDSLGFAYDGANQLARIDYPQGFSILYPRNAAGQVSQVQLQVGSGQPSSFASGISYLPFGPLKSLTWANGVSLSRTYDQDYRLTEQTVGGWSSTYGYDTNSNITTLNSSLLGDLNYSYDALDRLTAEQKANLQQTYSYDAVGNRTGKTTTPIVSGEAQTSTQQTYQYASNSNRLTQIDAQAVITDAAGNLTQDRANRELVYDAQNRLTSVKLGGNTVAEFRYNALGQRTHKISAQGTTTFLYGPDGQLLGEQQFNSQGSKLSGQYYIWLDSMPLGGVSITFDTQGGIASSTPFYLHSDHLNTPRMATNQTQQNVWQWQSDAFGVGLASGSLAMNLRFPGQYFDQESGLHYNYFRDYDPQTGRYVESDPIGLNGGLNTFAYSLLNPVTKYDPLGLFVPSDKTPAALAAMAEGAVNTAGIASVASTSTKPQRSPEDEKQAQSEHDWYKAQCSLKAPPTGDPCKDLLNEMNRFQQCAYLMDQWDGRWEPNRHYLDILQMNENYRRAKEKYDKNCKPDCQ